MRSFVCVMAGLVALFFIAALALPAQKAEVAMPTTPPTNLQDHHGSPAYRGADESKGNDDDVVICDHTTNGYPAAVFYRAGGDIYGRDDSNGANSGCSHGGVPGRLEWHLTCRDINQTWFYEGARCGPTSFH